MDIHPGLHATEGQAQLLYAILGGMSNKRAILPALLQDIVEFDEA
jgi:hypothetical protein